jgi:hypothetical protein
MKLTNNKVKYCYSSVKSESYLFFRKIHENMGGIVMVKKKISTALTATLIVSMLATGAIVAIQGKTTLDIATAGDKKVEVIKGIENN